MKLKTFLGASDEVGRLSSVTSRLDELEDWVVIDKVLSSPSAQHSRGGEEESGRVNAGELCNHLHVEGAECRHFSGHLEVRGRRGVANEGQKGTRGELPGERTDGWGRKAGGRGGDAAKNAVFI